MSLILEGNSYSYTLITNTRFVPKISVLIFLRSIWQHGISMMSIGTMVITLAVYSYLFQLDQLSHLYTTTVWIQFVMFVVQGNIRQLYDNSFCAKFSKSASKTISSLTNTYGDASLSTRWLWTTQHVWDGATEHFNARLWVFAQVYGDWSFTNASVCPVLLNHSYSSWFFRIFPALEPFRKLWGVYSFVCLIIILK